MCIYTCMHVCTCACKNACMQVYMRMHEHVQQTWTLLEAKLHIRPGGRRTMLKFQFTHEETLQTQETRIRSLKQVNYSLLSAWSSQLQPFICSILCKTQQQQDNTLASTVHHKTFPTEELWTLSLWLCSAQQLVQQLRGTVFAAQCWADTALTFCCSGGGPRQPWSSELAPVSRFHSSVPLFPLVPVPNRPSRLRGR